MGISSHGCLTHVFLSTRVSDSIFDANVTQPQKTPVSTQILWTSVGVELG